MASAIAYVLVGISIALLSIYGADVAVSQGAESGFLPLDGKTRGIGIGGPSIVLPFIAYVISRREASVGLGAMIIVSGALVAVGGAAVLALADPSMAMEEGRNAAMEAGPLVGIGVLVAALGAHRMMRPRR